MSESRDRLISSPANSESRRWLRGFIDRLRKGESPILTAQAKRDLQARQEVNESKPMQPSESRMMNVINGTDWKDD